MGKKAVAYFFIISFLTFVSCMKEDFGGIGIEVPTGIDKVSKTNRYRIESVFRGGPGESAGLKAGDRVAAAANFLIDSEAKLKGVEPLKMQGQGAGVKGQKATTLPAHKH